MSQRLAACEAQLNIVGGPHALSLRDPRPVPTCRNRKRGIYSTGSYAFLVFERDGHQANHIEPSANATTPDEVLQIVIARGSVDVLAGGTMTRERIHITLLHVPEETVHELIARIFGTIAVEDARLYEFARARLSVHGKPMEHWGTVGHILDAYGLDLQVAH